MSVAEINKTDDYGLNTVNDPRMGVIEDNTLCLTCSKDNMTCPGHLGHIELATKLYHPLFMRRIIEVLNCVCNTCGRLLLSREEMESRGLLRYSGLTRLKALETASKDVPCRHETDEAGVIPCTSNVTYLPQRIKETKQIYYTFSTGKGEKEEILKPISEVYQILNSISQEDAILMGFGPDSHPRRMILEVLAVIPPAARPPVIIEGVVRPYDLTTMYISIIRYNNNVKAAKTEEERDKETRRLYSAVEHFMTKTDGQYATGRNQDFITVQDLIQGKTAIPRSMMMGKRVDYSARTVISPDPSLRFGQISIPRVMAPVLTQPVTVAAFNRDALMKLLREGKITHITHGEGKMRTQRRQVNDTIRQEYQLEIGDLVERWLQNGDYVLFNRQPTLHKQSMMAYEVVLTDRLTIGLHLSYTTPHNADFDGDESAIYALQTLDAKAEAEYLETVKECVMSGQTNRPMIGIVMDALDGSYLLTQPDTIVEAADFMDCLALMTVRDQLGTLWSRLEKYRMNPRSGRALFSALLPDDFFYQKGDVIIQEGILVSGVVGKDHIGMAHNSIIQVLWKNYGRDRVAGFLTDAPFVMNRWLQENPFSIGVKDCYVPGGTVEKIIQQEFAKASLQIESMGPRPSDTIEGRRHEEQIIAIVNGVKNIGSRILTESLAPDNAFRIMAKAGSKGSEFNVAQALGALSQQFVYGERPTGRLPWFDQEDFGLEARGFIQGSFARGLSPAELFFHHTSGRIGLSSAATSVASSGANSHRLIKALEDLKVMYDYSVRNANNVIIQELYGYDGFNAAELQNVKTVSGDTASFIDLNASAMSINGMYGFSG
jgi:DNA-directed RNA polymerase II subunit RPB1